MRASEFAGLALKREIGFGSVAVRCVAIAMRCVAIALRCDAKLCVCVCVKRRGSAGWCFQWAVAGVAWRGMAVPWRGRVPPHPCNEK